MNLYLFVAGLFSAFTCGLHVILGGKAAAASLLASRDMHRVAVYTNYYCWHMVTLVLAVQAVAFLWAAVDTAAYAAAVMAAGLAVLFMVWSLLLILWKKQRFLQLPQWILFLAISAAALPGLR